MGEAEPFGMEHLPRDYGNEFFLAGKLSTPPSLLETMDRISHERVSRIGEMYPDLMGTSGSGPNRQQRESTSQFLDFLPEGDGLLPSRGDGHLLSPHRMARNGEIDLDFPVLKNSMCDCEIS